MKRIKLLFFILLIFCGLANAQDVVRTLVISEARMDRADDSYIELTNMGSTDINLSDFSFGRTSPWDAPQNDDPYQAPDAARLRLPDVVLAPGESYVIACVLDFTEEQWAKDVARFGYSRDYNERITKEKMWDLADMQINMPEANGDETDSVSDHYSVMETWWGRDCWWLRYHVSDTDSVVVDQVGGLFTDGDGTNPDGGYQDVAGVTGATSAAVLVRKFNVMQGDTNFNDGRGLDLAESQWEPVPYLAGTWEPNRQPFWTVGNHGNYTLDESSLTSSTVDIDWTNHVLTVPWGVRNDDSLIYQFDKSPGIAWHYDYSANHEDSAYVSARTGDTLTVYACGNTLSMIKFAIEVSAPAADAAIVVPKKVPTVEGDYTNNFTPYNVTDGQTGGDVIKEVPFATRVDTLLKYLEKAPDASWEIVWVDGTARPDLKDGDILRVTAEDGTTTKDYTINVRKHRADRDAYLSAITWPDIPEDYKDIAFVLGWKGDTIPTFSSTNYQYNLQVPYDYNGIPQLIGKSEDVNASVDVQRAVNLFGTTADRTITFDVSAEDDTSKLSYKVLLSKELAQEDVQPYNGEPFISQFVWQEQWANAFMEICNPGNQPLDLSHYMLTFEYNNGPVASITRLDDASIDTWNARYGKYIPGYKWADSTAWKDGDVAIAHQDLATNAIVQPGDVFVIGDLQTWGTGGFPWFASEACDILLETEHNPWGEYKPAWTALQQWSGCDYYLWRIDNDSILAGTKKATDPEDFTLIDAFGSLEDDPPVIGGLPMQQINGYERKEQYHTGVPELEGSFGTDQETSQWYFYNDAYYNARGVGWPNNILFVANGLGNHNFDEVTEYKSTVSSLVYKASTGYSMDEQIRGVVTGTTVADFLGNILKADDGQVLTVKSGDDTLASGDVVTDGDVLVVVSANEENTSAYTLEVTDQGLSDDAILTSDDYTIEADEPAGTGTVGGMDFGTTLEDVVGGIEVPAGASMAIVDPNDNYVSMNMLNFDTSYVKTLVSNQIFFDVTSESGDVNILYQMVPNAMSSDAFVTSAVFMVDQDQLLISLIPRDITVPGLMQNLIPATGASVMLVDKAGFERTWGPIYKDDLLVVTSEDETNTVIYTIGMLTRDDELSDLAFVTSDVYDVDQLKDSISGVGTDYIYTDLSVGDFLADITPAEGATATVVDADMVEKTSGEMAEGDMVMVTAENGYTIVYYMIHVVPLSVNPVGDESISLYPNPSQGEFYVTGLKTGYRMQIYNSLGMSLRDIRVDNPDDPVSMKGQPNGVYFVIISDGKDVIARCKLIKK